MVYLSGGFVPDVIKLKVADVDHTRPVIYSDMLTELVEVKISEQAIAVDRQVAGTKVNNTRIVE